MDSYLDFALIGHALEIYQIEPINSISDQKALAFRLLLNKPTKQKGFLLPNKQLAKKISLKAIKRANNLLSHYKNVQNVIER